jgi:hypothetical protein
VVAGAVGEGVGAGVSTTAGDGVGAADVGAGEGDDVAVGASEGPGVGAATAADGASTRPLSVSATTSAPGRRRRRVRESGDMVLQFGDAQADRRPLRRQVRHDGSAAARAGTVR